MSHANLPFLDQKSQIKSSQPTTIPPLIIIILYTFILELETKGSFILLGVVVAWRGMACHEKYNLTRNTAFCFAF
jgi:hypothetical protein